VLYTMFNVIGFLFGLLIAAGLTFLVVFLFWLVIAVIFAAIDGLL